MSKEANEVLPEGVTAEQVKVWKEQYGEDSIRLAELKKNENTGETIFAVMHTPNRAIIGEFEKWSDSNPDKAKEILIKGCFLTKLDDILAPGNTLLFLSAFNACSKVLPKAESTIKNL